MTSCPRHASIAARLLVMLAVTSCRTPAPHAVVHAEAPTRAGTSAPEPAPPKVTSVPPPPAPTPAPAPAPEPPLALRCEDEQIKIPRDWERDTLAVEFAPRSTRTLSHIDPDRFATLVAELRARRELAVYLEGFRVEDDDTLRTVLRRMQAVRNHLLQRGVLPNQVLLKQLSEAPRLDNYAAEIRLIRRPADPVAPGEPCGTRTLRISPESPDSSLETHGLWAQERRDLYGLHHFRIPARSLPLDPLRGESVAPLARHDHGYLAVAWHSVNEIFEFGLFDRRSHLQRVQTLSFPDHEARSIALVPHARGFLAAWISGGEIYTVTLDPAGTPLRSPSREVDEGVSVHGMAMDWHLGRGGIAYVTLKALEARYTQDMRLKYISLDEDGHVRGAPRTIMAQEPWIGSVAVAVLSADRISVLVNACDTFVRRLDLDAEGELVALDKQFLRQPNGLGAAVVRRADAVWAASLGQEWVDLRPLCEPPAAALPSAH